MSPVNVLVTVLTRDRDSPRVARTQGIGAIVNLYDFSSRYCSPRGSPSPSLPLSSPKIPPGNFQRRWWGGRWKESFATRSIRATGKLAAQCLYRDACSFSLRNRENIADGPIQSLRSTLRGANVPYAWGFSYESQRILAASNNNPRASSLTSLQRLFAVGRDNRLNWIIRRKRCSVESKQFWRV